VLEEKGRIIESADGFACVQMQKKSACSSCSAAKGCGVSVLEQTIGTKVTNISASNEIGAEVGEDVIVAVDEGFLLKGSLLVYGLPLVVMMVAALLGDLAGRYVLHYEGDSVAVLFGFCGLLGAVIWLRRSLQNVASSRHYQPVIVRRCSQHHML